MRPSLLNLSLLLAVPAVVAQEGGALESVECRAALEALRTQETAAAAVPAVGPEADEAAHHVALARLKAARDHAARACLQGRADLPALPGRFVPPPLSVPPPLAVMPQPAPLPRSPAGIAVPLPRPAPPVSVTSCDTLGCWASDGTRLPRAGPNLLGPRGFCSAPGGMLQCPP